MKKQLIWVFEWRKSVYYWWSHILFSPECKELTSMLDPLLYSCYQVCALDHANGGTADLDYSSGLCHRNVFDNWPVESWIIKYASQLALRRWPNVGPTSTLTLGQRRLTNVGPTWICQLAQRWPNGCTPTLCQHRPNVGTLTLGQRWHNVMPMVVCQRCTNIGPTEAALLAFCEGNPSVTDRSPVEQTVELSNQWFETPIWSTSM